MGQLNMENVGAASVDSVDGGVILEFVDTQPEEIAETDRYTELAQALGFGDEDPVSDHLAPIRALGDRAEESHRFERSSRETAMARAGRVALTLNFHEAA